MPWCTPVQVDSWSWGFWESSRSSLHVGGFYPRSMYFFIVSAVEPTSKSTWTQYGIKCGEYYRESTHVFTFRAQHISRIVTKNMVSCRRRTSKCTADSGLAPASIEKFVSPWLVFLCNQSSPCILRFNLYTVSTVFLNFSRNSRRQNNLFHAVIVQRRRTNLPWRVICSTSSSSRLMLRCF